MKKKNHNPHLPQNQNPMIKKYLYPFIIFSLLFIALLVIGLAGSIYYSRCLCLSFYLNKSEISEKGIITGTVRRNRTFNTNVYLTLENQTTVYTESVFKTITNEPKVGGEIEVIFNKNRNFFVIKNFIVATCISYAVTIIICMICLYLSFLFGKSVLILYKEIFK